MSQQQFAPTQPLEAAQTLAPPGKARGFFGRHLHGDFPLARSYWVHMLLQSLAAGVALALIPWLSQNMRARYASVAAPSARIGFHRGRAVGSVGGSRDVPQLRAFYERAGLPAAFIHR